jgi:hypothetical protein
MLRIRRCKKIWYNNKSAELLNRKHICPHEVNMVIPCTTVWWKVVRFPVGEVLTLEAIDPRKHRSSSPSRNGIYNVGGSRMVKAGDAEFGWTKKKLYWYGRSRSTFEAKTCPSSKSTSTHDCTPATIPTVRWRKPCRVAKWLFWRFQSPQHQ